MNDLLFIEVISLLLKKPYNIEGYANLGWAHYDKRYDYGGN